MSGSSASLRSGCVIADRLIVLDLDASRYFSALNDPAEPSPIPAPPDHRTEILSWPDDRPPRRNTARVTWVDRARVAPGDEGKSANLATLLRLWREERRAARTLRAGIAAGIAALAATSRGEHDERAQRALIAASWRSRRLWSAEDRCLPRSIALARLLRQAGSDAKLVIGVMANPFAAHAWVQDGDVAVNDTLDHVLLFAPILVR